MHKFAHQACGLAAILLATGVLAEETRPLDALSACRLDENRVALQFTFEGGACQKPGEATLDAAKGGVGNVTVPTHNEGDVCTMQIVPVEFSGVLTADPEITSLDITVLKPDGKNRQALGSVDVATGPEECVEPEPKAE
jgi:hypothetical protein